MVVVRWPDEEATRQRLRAAGVPRLLLVDAGAPPPTVTDDLEDWIREPAAEIDLDARAAAVDRRARARSRSPGDDAPAIDGDGVVRFGDRWDSLPPIEARLATALLRRGGAVVGRDALIRAGWPHGTASRNALDVHVLRLRRRLAPLALAIRTVRSRGYLLEPEDRDPAPPASPSDRRQETVRDA